MAEARSRGYFGIGVEGIAASARRVQVLRLPAEAEAPLGCKQFEIRFHFLP